MEEASGRGSRAHAFGVGGDGVPVGKSGPPTGRLSPASLFMQVRSVRDRPASAYSLAPLLDDPAHSSCPVWERIRVHAWLSLTSSESMLGWVKCGLSISTDETFSLPGHTCLCQGGQLSK